MPAIKDEKGHNQIYSGNLAAKIRKERRTDFMIAEMGGTQLQQSPNVLEIGCGTGETIARIAEKTGATCLGIDLSEKFIKQASQTYKNKNLKFEVANFLEWQSSHNNKFDFIIGNGILHHLYHNIDQALESSYRLLKTGGKIIFIEPNIWNPYVALIFKIPFLRKKAHLEPGEMAFSSGFIRSKLKKAQFTNCKIKSKDFLLPNTPDKLIKPVISLGSILEKTPLTYVAQSIFITATK